TPRTTTTRSTVFPYTTLFRSVFAGRIADTGQDPVPLMREMVQFLTRAPNVELIWASPRELLNVFQADAIGCHIITATNDILKKLDRKSTRLNSSHVAISYAVF